MGTFRIFKHYLFNLFLRPFVIAIMVFLGIRVLLLGVYPDYFSNLSIMQTVKAMLWGLKFDISILAFAYALPLLIIFVALFSIRHYSKLIKVALWLSFALFSVLWWLYIGSVGYFGEVNRHLGYELVQLSSDASFIVSLASSSHLIWLLAATLLLVFLGVVWSLVVIRPALAVPSRGNSKKSKLILPVVVLLVLEVYSVRGLELTGKPLAIADAYALGSEQQAAVAMNGAFSAVHNVRRSLKNKEKPIQYFPGQTLEALAAAEDFERVVPDYYPDEAEPKNLVVILLESWSYKYIDGLTGNNYGATPFMDELLAKSAYWDNFYAAGQRSIEGIQAILTSVPLIEGRSTLGFGLEQQKMTSIAKAAKQHGYQTAFMQTSKRRSFHVDAIAAALGFDDYFGMEDFPKILDYGKEDSDFGWDYEGLDFFANHLAQDEFAQKPFFAFFFTGTTHEPFPNPGAEFNIYPHDSDWENRYLNTLKYSDWALQKFMEKMEQHPKYNDTVFVFVADHVLKASTGSKHENFQIPLVVYAPDGSIPAGKRTEFASQYDLLPTMDSILGIDSGVSIFGRSLLTEPALLHEGALSKQGSVGVWLMPQEQWVSFNAANGKLLEASTEVTEEISNALKWKKMRLQLADQSLRNNRWFTEQYKLAELEDH